VGPIGPQGPAGAAGAAGAAGPSGFAGAASSDLDPLMLTTAFQPLASGISVTAPDDASVTALIQADGDLYLSGATGNYGLVEVRLMVDDVAVRMIRAEVLNNVVSNLSNSWHVHTMMTLTPGAHQIRVDARTVSSSRAVQINNNPGKLSAVMFRP
jgi:hypothetical protein